jgi:large subunit ribosomal protein L47
MARIKYILNERRLALIAAAASNNTSSAALSLLPPFSSVTNRADPLSAAEALATPEGEVRNDVLRSPASDEIPAAIEPGTDGAPEDGVAQEEVEARDEGFGGGREAQDFVEDKIPGVTGSNVKGGS